MKTNSLFFRHPFFAIGAAGIVCLALLLYCIPIPIHLQYHAIEIKLDDSDYMIDRTILLNGTYDLNILQTSYFQGSIEVSGCSQTSEELLRIDINADYKENGAALWYREMSESVEQKTTRSCFGILYSDIFFSNPFILRFDTSQAWSTEDGYCIVSGVSTREAALDKLRNRNVIH